MCDELQRTLEALLFAAGEAVPLDVLAQACNSTALQVAVAADALRDHYLQQGHGIRLLRLGDSLQLSTDPDLAPTIRAMLEPVQTRNLSQSAIETLSVIAYRQPVTRREIEAIRGVKCDYAVSTMLERGLIRVVGHSDALGHPELLGTTEEFLRVFALESIAQLPHLESISPEELAQISLPQKEEGEENP